MSVSEERWFEVWYSEGIEVAPYYLLIVTPDKNDSSSVVIIDPQKNYEVVHEGRSYEDTKLWLLEDEYTLVNGREFPDDGW